MGVESEKFETSVPSSENQNFNWSRTGEGILYGINFRYIYGIFFINTQKCVLYGLSDPASNQRQMVINVHFKSFFNR